jgi:hypothetical protein
MKDGVSTASSLQLARTSVEKHDMTFLLNTWGLAKHGAKAGCPKCTNFVNSGVITVKHIDACPSCVGGIQNTS